MDLTKPGTTRREIRAQERIIEAAQRENRERKAGTYGKAPVVLATVGRAPETAFRYPEFLEV